jgi:hypothetical protein
MVEGAVLTRLTRLASVLGIGFVVDVVQLG